MGFGPFYNKQIKTQSMTQVYEIQTGKSKVWQKIRATSMEALAKFAKENDYIKDWRMVGMQSRSETLSNQNLFVLC